MQQCEHWSKSAQKKRLPTMQHKNEGLWGGEVNKKGVRMTIDHQAQAQASRPPEMSKSKVVHEKTQLKNQKPDGGFGGRDFWRWDAGAAPFLLLQGEFQSVAEDLDSLLLITGSVCRGRLTVEAEHLPAERNTESRAFILTPWETAGRGAKLELLEGHADFRRESWRRRVTLASTCDHVRWSYI